jgi:glucose-6-phosphate isomerase
MKFHDLKIYDNVPADWSQFFDFREDLDYLKREAKKIDIDFENVVIIGNGGSITSAKACSNASCCNKDGWIIDSPDPALIRKVKSSCPQNSTVVVAVSKSGDTLGVTEALMAFSSYKVIVITEGEDGLLRQIAQKMNWQIVEHPNVPGRYSGATSAALFPELLLGMKIDGIASGIKAGYKYKKEAWSLAKYYFDLENKGYLEVYVSAYSWFLENFRTLIVQLMHESVCKNGKGQTFYFSEAPECQHHTNQRFFGGKKNVVGTFIIVREWWDDKKISVPEKLADLNLKGLELKKLDEISYQQALVAEYHGTKTEADRLIIPNVTIELPEITNQTVGELLAFWQLVAFYSAILRGVDPFNEPAVTNSKNITIEEIKKI